MNGNFAAIRRSRLHEKPNIFFWPTARVDGDLIGQAFKCPSFLIVHHLRDHGFYVLNPIADSPSRIRAVRKALGYVRDLEANPIAEATPQYPTKKFGYRAAVVSV
jgi:hypothetical protein